MAFITDVNSTDFMLNQMTLDDDDDDDVQVREPKKDRKSLTTNAAYGSSDKNTEKNSESTKICNDISFDTVVGCIEDMLIDEEFNRLQTSFLEKYWTEFEHSEENKHSYMRIFMEYTSVIEEFIEVYLSKLLPGFSMDNFIAELEQRKNELEGEVFEVLFTLTDFELFKEMFLDYRSMKEGKVVDFGQSLSVKSIR